MTKIEWTDETWNPVWGCKANCEYCYARNISHRFAAPVAEMNSSMPETIEMDYKLRNFIPVFLPAQYQKELPKKPKRIFVGSMSDIAFWEREWIEKVAHKIKQYPQHNFQLLTKFPEIYTKLDKVMPDNVWFGITVTNEKDLEKIVISHEPNRLYYLSFEPLTEDLHGELQTSDLHMFNWVIIGTMSGKRRIPAKIEWIRNIIEVANAIYGLPIFVKQIEINGKVEKDISKFPEDLQLRQFPKTKTTPR